LTGWPGLEPGSVNPYKSGGVLADGNVVASTAPSPCFRTLHLLLLAPRPLDLRPLLPRVVASTEGFSLDPAVAENPPELSPPRLTSAPIFRLSPMLFERRAVFRPSDLVRRANSSPRGWEPATLRPPWRSLERPASLRKRSERSTGAASPAVRARAPGRGLPELPPEKARSLSPYRRLLSGSDKTS
jgi:hypothetical protein